MGNTTEWIKTLKVPALKHSYNKVKMGRKLSDHYKLMHFVDDSDEELKVGRELIRAANYMTYASLPIVTTSENIDLLNYVANSNISFSSRTDSVLTHLKNADLVLANREMAVIAVLSRVPVIVAGNKGLGGLVCSDNLPDFIRTDFQGRIGGALKEKIPINLLDYEIKYALGIEGDVTINQITGEQYQALENYHENDWQTEFLSIMDSTILQSTYVRSKHLSLKLTPRVSDSIFLQTMKSGELSLINILSGKLIGTVGSEESSIIKACAGTLNIGDIISKYGDYGADNIRNFILQLWANKVLSLQSPYIA